MSQLALALAADTSTRHLSFIESGRSVPSRAVLTRLADALAIPLRERNVLWLAAGYAPEYPERPLTPAHLPEIWRAMHLILSKQEPYPAFVVNRYWDVLRANDSARRVFARVRGGRPPLGNVVRDVFSPDGLRPALENWREVAADLIRLLHHQVAASPNDERLRGLLDGVLQLPEMPRHWQERDPATPAPPILTAAYRCGDLVLRFFSTITTFGAPFDVTLDELRIECAFPADDATAEFCRSLAEDAPRRG